MGIIEWETKKKMGCLATALLANSGDGWDVDLIRAMVGENKMEEVLECLGAHKEGADLLIWKPNPSGEFTSKSAWDCIRIRVPKSSWSN